MCLKILLVSDTLCKDICCWLPLGWKFNEARIRPEHKVEGCIKWVCNDCKHTDYTIPQMALLLKTYKAHTTACDHGKMQEKLIREVIRLTQSSAISYALQFLWCLTLMFEV